MSSPPRFAKLLLRLISLRERDEAFWGDLEELFQNEDQQPGRQHSRLWYWGEVFRALPRFICDWLYWRWSMFKNNLKIVGRNLFRSKSYSFINIFGLSIGVACCLLILGYIGYELSYDGFHANADRIHRLATRRTDMGRTREMTLSLAPVGPTMVQEFPEVLDAVRFGATVKRVFKYQDRVFFQERVFYVDRAVFDVFSFELIKGDPNTALEVPFTMVLTEDTAKKYFGDEDPLGKFVNWDNKFDYQVTGIVKNPPPNSHFIFEVLASFSTYIKYDARIGSWQGGSFPTYLLLLEDTDPEVFEQKVADFNQKYVEPIFRDSGTEIETFLQPLRGIHLNSRLEFELGANGDIRMVYTFAAIALVILMIACINFMNLSTARSSRRAKEVGLRKVLGAEKSKLVFQFLSETFLYAFLSMAAALLVAQLLLPYFKQAAGREITLTSLGMTHFTFGLLGILLFIGFAAGSYPAFFLSAFQPVSVLRGRYHQGPKGARFRSFLVVFQFVISIILIISTIIIFNQQKYMINKDLGFNKENLLVIALQNQEVRAELELFKHELLGIDGVESVGASSMVPGEMYLFNRRTLPEGMSTEQSFMMDNFLVDHGFLDTMGIEILEGRNFSPDITTDARDAVLINETAARRLEWDLPLGKTFELSSSDAPQNKKKNVIGVFRDIHQRSLYSPVNPTIVEYVSNEGAIENRARRLILRLETSDLQSTLMRIEKTWSETYPNNPYFSFFLDDFYDAQHQGEAKLGLFIRAFSVLAVLVACVGLFGLASYIAERRTKEIGIRKVIGARVSSIVSLLCRDFLLLITAANVLAWPIALYAMKKWLQGFPYPVDIRLGTFVFAGVLTLTVALLTVGSQSLRAALANPVDSLRYE
jgi:putative ABC transport system permease protein